MRTTAFSISRQGFTLLELMVAAALSVILVVAVAALLGRGLTVWRRTDVELQQLFLVEKGLNMLGRELRNGVALADQAFEGTETGVTFTTAEEPTRLSLVRYTLVSQGGRQALVRQWEPFPNPEAVVQTKTLIPQVKSFSLTYGILEKVEGQEQFRWSTDWQKSPNPPQQLPELLRVQCEIENPPYGRPLRVIREFRIPHGVLRSSSVE